VNLFKIIYFFALKFNLTKQLMKDNIIELKHRKLEHSKQMGILDMNLKPEKDNKNLLNVGFFRLIFFVTKAK
jgi:hypothetical protein